MTCGEIEDLILESFEASMAPDPSITEHLGSCASCRAFQQTQIALDGSLAACYTAPALSAHFDQELHRRIAADRRRALWESAPDVLHLGGGLAGSAVCAWLLPEAAGRVMFFGAGFTLTAYVLQILVRGWLEQAE